PLVNAHLIDQAIPALVPGPAIANIQFVPRVIKRRARANGAGAVGYLGAVEVEPRPIALAIGGADELPLIESQPIGGRDGSGCPPAAIDIQRQTVRLTTVGLELFARTIGAFMQDTAIVQPALTSRINPGAVGERNQVVEHRCAHLDDRAAGEI